MEQQPGKLIPGLIGGAAIGILSTLPIINLGNCLCCMWVAFGGALAAYIYHKSLPKDISITSVDGALAGLLAGLFGALFFTFLTYFFMAVIGFRPGGTIIDSLLESRNDISPEVEELLEELRHSGEVNPFFVLIQLISSLVINAVFGAIGGIIGAAFLKKQTGKIQENKNEPSEQTVNQLPK